MKQTGAEFKTVTTKKAKNQILMSQLPLMIIVIKHILDIECQVILGVSTV